MASDLSEYLATFPAWVFVEYLPSEGEEVASIFEPQPTTSWKRLLDDAPAV